MITKDSPVQLNLFVAKAKPFLKWAGGKSQLLEQMDPFFPKALKEGKIRRYIEPFVGGGAVFFHLWNTDRLPKDIYLFDNNKELINTYKVVRNNIEALIVLLSFHEQRHSREYYYRIRGLDRQPGLLLSDVEIAARTIYLNRTCYNGLHRVNSNGQFNVPMGSYKNPKILHKEVLLAASAALQGVAIEVWDFQTVLDIAGPNDFIYFDPPYDPVSKTASFTSYTAGNFRDEDQHRLAEVYAELSNRGCFCMLSNSHTHFILDLYRDFRINIVQAARAINSDPNGRGAIDEVLVLNYE